MCKTQHTKWPVYSQTSDSYKLVLFSEPVTFCTTCVVWFINKWFSWAGYFQWSEHHWFLDKCIVSFHQNSKSWVTSCQFMIMVLILHVLLVTSFFSIFITLQDVAECKHSTASTKTIYFSHVLLFMSFVLFFHQFIPDCFSF